MTTTVNFTIAESESDFEVMCTTYSPGEKRTWHYPGSASEVEPGPFVEVSRFDGTFDVVTYETFLIEFAISEGKTLSEADDFVLDELRETHERKLRDDYDDYMDRRGDGPGDD